MVGAPLERERELGTLREGLDRAAGGEGTLVLIEGPAGVGKSELVREARGVAERTGVLAVEARGSELERAFAFGVVRQLLEPVINGPAGRAGLFAGAAGPAKRLFGSHDGRVRAGGDGFEALHSLYWLVVNLADRGPLAILVDDCQWADRESLRFVGYLAQRIEGLPIAVVLAGRPPDAVEDEAASLWSQVGSRPSAIVLYPRPLSEPAAVALARERLGAEADEAFCRACHVATGGNPLFLRELLRALEAARVVPSAAAASAVQAVGPAAVSRFVLHRLGALGASATELARAVAVLGDGSEPELAARVSGLPAAVARDAADDLVRADIFARGERLAFVHPIVRAALYEDLLPGERHARHAAVAHTLARAGASPERITAHLVRTTPTGDPDRVRTLRSAADGAAHHGALSAAVAWLRRALAESPAEQQRGEILCDLGRWEVAAMQFEAAEEHLRACLTSGADLPTRADAAATFARCAVVSGGRSAEAAADALATLGDELRPVDAERALELGSELVTLAIGVPRLRGLLAGQLQRFRAEAAGHPGFEAVARIYDAHAAAVARRLCGDRSGGDPGGPRRRPAAGDGDERRPSGALHAARRASGTRWRCGCSTRRPSRPGARATRPVRASSTSTARRSRSRTGRCTTRRSRPTPGCGWSTSATSCSRCCSRWRSSAHLERGTLADALELARRGEALELTAEGTYAQLELAVARARLRIAQGDVRGGAGDLAWWGEGGRGSGPALARHVEGPHGPRLGLAGRARDGRRPGRRAARGRATRGGARRAGNGVARRGARGGRAGPAPAARGGRVGPGAQLVPAGARVRAGRPRPRAARAPGGAARAATPSAAPSRSPTPAARCPWRSRPGRSCRRAPGAAPGSS